jgi:hypothetical protein
MPKSIGGAAKRVNYPYHHGRGKIRRYFFRRLTGLDYCTYQWVDYVSELLAPTGLLLILQLTYECIQLRWNDWRILKNFEKSCLTLSTTNLTWTEPAWTRASALRGRPESWHGHQTWVTVGWNDVPCLIHKHYTHYTTTFWPIFQVSFSSWHVWSKIFNSWLYNAATKINESDCVLIQHKLVFNATE